MIWPVFLISCGITFAATTAIGLPISYDLIVNHKDKVGWVGPLSVIVGIVMTCVGLAYL